MIHSILKVIAALLATAFGTSLAHAQLLWKISGKDMEKPSYIFGTHHVAPISVIDSVKGLRPALGEVGEVWGEVVMDSISTPEGQQRLMASFMAPADSTLSKVLSPAQLDSLQQYISANISPMVSVQNFDQFKPIMLLVSIETVNSMKAFPEFNPQQQLDTEIQKIALAAGKTVGGLETVADQVKVLSGQPIAMQARSLMQAIADPDDSIEQMLKLAHSYRTGDLVALAECLEGANSLEDRVMYEALLCGRNNKWVARILPRLASAPTLYVVGAGHLVGESGLIRQLRENGYTVEPF